MEQRYVDAFADLGPGALQDFRHLIDCVEDFFDLLLDDGTKPLVKMLDYGRVRADVAEFCRYYARWLGTPLMERLKAEIYEILEQALDGWGKRQVCDSMEG